MLLYGTFSDVAKRKWTTICVAQKSHFVACIWIWADVAVLMHPEANHVLARHWHVGILSARGGGLFRYAEAPAHGLGSQTPNFHHS
jgi:hypothetical protein